MGNGKKSKGSRGRGPGSRGEEPMTQDVIKNWSTLQLQSKLAIVKQLWDTLSHEERIGLLTIPISDLRKKATEVAWTQRQKSGVNVPKALEEGLARLKEGTSWKRWQMDGCVAHDSSPVRRWVEHEYEVHKPGDFAPGQSFKSGDMKLYQDAERRNFNSRMTQLRANVVRCAGHVARGGPTAELGTWSTTDMEKDIDDICYILQEVALEQECVYNMLLQPVISYIRGALKVGQRSTTEGQLHFQDLDRLHPTQVASIRAWLVQKLGGLAWLSTFLASEPQEHVLRPNGAVEELKDDERATVMVEWVLGGFQASWGEKARELAKSALGQGKDSLVVEGQQLLTAAIKRVNELQEGATACHLLMHCLVNIRKSITSLESDSGSIEVPWADLAKACDVEDDAKAAEAARSLLLLLLDREKILLTAKFKSLAWWLDKRKGEVAKLASEIQQVDIHWERTQRDRAALGAQDPLEPLKTAQILAERGRISRTRERNAAVMGKETAEFEKIHGQWRSVMTWYDHLKGSGASTPAPGKGEAFYAAALANLGRTICAAPDRNVREAGMASTGVQEAKQGQLDFYLQLGGLHMPQSRAQEGQIYATLSKDFGEMLKPLVGLGVVLPLMVAHLEDVACDDPGPIIKDQLLLPLLEQRLERAAAKHIQEAHEALAQKVETRSAELASLVADALLRQEAGEKIKRRIKEQQRLEDVVVRDTKREMAKISVRIAEIEKDLAARQERGELESEVASEDAQGLPDAWQGSPGSCHAAADKPEQRPSGSEHTEGTGSVAAGGPGSQGPGASRLGQIGDDCGLSGQQEVGAVRPERHKEASSAAGGSPVTGRRARRRKGKGNAAEGSGSRRLGRGQQGDEAQAAPAEPSRRRSLAGDSPSGGPEAAAGGCGATGRQALRVDPEDPAAQKLYQKIPKEVEDIVCCPISQELMVDAVTADDGRTYSQAAIQQWLDTGARTSPLTNIEMGTTLLPNTLIRSIVQACLAHLEQSGQ